MEIQSAFEKVYEAYKISDDKTIFIEGIEYFKIISKQKIGKYETVVIPNDVFYTKGNTLKDEKGNIFTVDSPVTYAFKTKIPEWYMKTVTVMLKDTTSDKIGDYISLVE